MNDHIYENYSINKLLFTFSIPAILSLIIEMLTSVVDAAFAGHLGSNSENALTAMGLVSPLLAVFVALQSLFAVATAIKIATYLGQNDIIKLHKYFKSGIIMTLFINMITSFITYLFLKPLLSYFGATEDVYRLAYDYLQIILISNIFSSLGYLLTSSIRALGNPKTEAIIISLSVIMNISCNALFTFCFQLGIVGIALGTLVSELVCAFISFIYLYKKQLWPASTTLLCRELLFIAYDLCKLGFVQTMIQVLAGASAFLVNHQLLLTGGNFHVGVWNIANKMYMLFLMPIIGSSQSVQNIIAYFAGSHDQEKQRITVRKTITLNILYGMLALAIIYVFGKNLLYLFTSNQDMMEAVINVERVIFITFPLLGITYTIITLLQVTGREMQALVLGITRQILTIIPLVILLPYIFNRLNISNISPSFSIFFSIPLADLFTLGIAVMFTRFIKEW